MRKILLFLLLFSIFAVSAFAYTNSCQLAYPMMEVLKCEKQETFTYSIPLTFNNLGEYTGTYFCKSDCSIHVGMTCNGLASAIYGVVSINGKQENLYTNDNAGFWASGEVLSKDFTAAEGDNIVVSMRCGGTMVQNSASVKDYNNLTFL